MKTYFKRLFGLFGVSLVVLVSFQFQAMASCDLDPSCPTFQEDSGATVTVCDNGDGTSTFTVCSSEGSLPGTCQGPADSSQGSYVV